MPRRTTAVACLVGLLVTLLVSVAAPGYADSYGHRDTTEDVVRVPRDGSSCHSCQGTDRRDADIIRFGASYAGRVRLVMTLRATPERGTVVWLVRYAPRTWLTVGLHVTPAGDWSCRLLRSSDVRRSVPCRDNIDWQVDPEHSLFHASVPGDLVDRASSIRVGAGSMSSAGSSLFFDDALRRKYNPVGVGLAMAAGPSIPRG